MQVGTNSSILTQGKNLMDAGQPYQSPRQRVWAAIRKHRNEFTIQQVAELGQMKYDSARDFITGLKNAGIISLKESVAVGHENSHVKQKLYQLDKDLGYNAPKVNRSGELLVTNQVNKAMWNTLRITRASVDADELAKLSSNDELSISALTANSYLILLYQAGYLAISKQGNSWVGRTKYRLLPDMNTGPIPPQIQRAKQVFDPNTNTVMYSERPELEEEIKHGTLLLNNEEINDE